MTIREFTEINNDQMNALDQSQVNDLLKRMVPQANRRLNRLREMEITPQALYSRLDENDELMPFKQKHGTLGKGKSELRNSKNEEDVKYFSRLVTEVSHNHSEGIKGAEATASAIFLARSGSTKAEIKTYIEENFHYDLSRTCDEIRPGYYHVESCQETVPEAITAFLEGDSFEDVIRTAVSLGGDCDTLTCIAGAIAEGFYGVPEELKAECRKRLDQKMAEILRRFDEYILFQKQMMEMK